jgi:hypothetical protein
MREGEREHDGGWRALLLPEPGEESAVALGARGVLLALLALWTLAFLRHGPDARYLMGSFLHLVHLPFHEAGHVFLMPFGRFLSVLGGSLFQVAIPLLCSAVFLLKNRDPGHAHAPEADGSDFEPLGAEPPLLHGILRRGAWSAAPPVIIPPPRAAGVDGARIGRADRGGHR